MASSLERSLVSPESGTSRNKRIEIDKGENNLSREMFEIRINRYLFLQERNYSLGVVQWLPHVKLNLQFFILSIRLSIFSSGKGSNRDNHFILFISSFHALKWKCQFFFATLFDSTICGDSFRD